MNQIIGNYSTALVYTDIIEETAAAQIKMLCDQPFAENCRIRIMPDVHAGKGSVIGFTADLGQLVIPSIVGVDIGCGMLTIELGREAIDFEKLDRIVREFVPSGMNIHHSPIVEFPPLEALLCRNHLKHMERICGSIGTLGGGNHFIEVDVDDDGNYYLVIHTGSRNLGKQVADHYQQLAWDTLFGNISFQQQRNDLIREYKAQGRTDELEQALKMLRNQERTTQIPRELCYLIGANRDAYIHDMAICQRYASLNRETIANQILSHLLGKTLVDFPHFQTIHNYIDHDSNIIRKGAVSAKLGERLLIPINMRDGSLICIGKGNPEWNYSAPHGAGRLFSRGVARKMFTLESFETEMNGIYTTSVNEDTLDECPMAYKPMESIVSNIQPTAEILRVVRPVYNFKAGE